MAEEKEKSKFETLYFTELSNIMGYENMVSEFAELKEFIEKLGLNNTMEINLMANGLAVNGKVEFHSNSIWLEYQSDFESEHNYCSKIGVEDIIAIRQDSEICIYKRVVLSVLIKEYKDFIDCFMSNEDKFSEKNYYIVFKNHFYFCL